MKRVALVLVVASLAFVVGCSASTSSSANVTLPVDLDHVHATFASSSASGAAGPSVAVAKYLRAVARGDAKSYFEMTGTHVTTAALTAVRKAVFHRTETFTVVDIWNNAGTIDGSGSIFSAVPETLAAELLQTTLRVNSANGRWFVSRATGTGLPPSAAVRKRVDAEVLERVKASAANTSTAMAKPVIYLYPTRTERVRVRLDVDGTITASAPAYDMTTRGWEVTATPDGRLTNTATGRAWPYLFWEADVRLLSEAEGDVVAGRDTVTYLEAKLAQLGLNAAERAGFIAYWTPRMSGNPYNLIRFEGAAYQKVARLAVTPCPDTVIRVFMTFSRLDFPVSVAPQRLSDPPARRGFTVVEWGAER